MRARIILVMVAFALTLPLWATGFAAGVKAPSGETIKRPSKTLSFYNTHTSEKLSISFQSATQNRDAIKQVNFLLRDHRNGKIKDINFDLLNVLHDIKTEAERRDPELDVVFHVISGFRSVETNEMLRRTRGGQAKKSRHTHGDAIDIRVPGLSTVALRNIAWCQQKGGVGYYKGSDFVHIDTHRVRFWNWNPAGLDCKKATS